VRLGIVARVVFLRRRFDPPFVHLFATTRNRQIPYELSGLGKDLGKDYRG
jgi:hypothetical protein